MDKNVRTFRHLLKQLVKAIIPYNIHNVIDYSSPCCYILFSDTIETTSLVVLSSASRKFELVGHISIRGKKKDPDIILIFRFHHKNREPRERSCLRHQRGKSWNENAKVLFEKDESCMIAWDMHYKAQIFLKNTVLVKSELD